VLELEQLESRVMHKKMTITIDEEVYNALYRVIGKGNISQFLENLARPHVLKEDLASAYQAMAADTEREREALEWSNGLIGNGTCN
jgi:predicted CopG family antitoxin